jgi:vancomycin aglycone glucosyltransferase
VTDNRVLWDLNAQSANALFGAVLNAGRASVGLAPVDNVYNYGFTDHPWLAAGGSPKGGDRWARLQPF